MFYLIAFIKVSKLLSIGNLSYINTFKFNLDKT